MIKIVKATVNDCELLSNISTKAFWESHGNSASKENIETFITKTYNKEVFIQELLNEDTIYHIIYYNNQAAGYSKIVLNVPHPKIEQQNSTKLDRLYLLKEYYNLKLGAQLFNFNIELSKTNKNTGIWLAVWIENFRAIEFYKKAGFGIVGSYNFKISETHSNPNHIMYLKY